MDQLTAMSEDEQRRILEIARSMSPGTRKGVKGGSLLRFAGSIYADDARLMSDAIEAGFERSRSAAHNPAFDFLSDDAEDIYTVNDGRPFGDQG
jgi:hypothetical protein